MSYKSVVISGIGGDEVLKVIEEGKGIDDVRAMQTIEALSSKLKSVTFMPFHQLIVRSEKSVLPSMELLILAKIVFRPFSLDTNAGSRNTSSRIKITTITNASFSILVLVLFFGLASSFSSASIALSLKKS